MRVSTRDGLALTEYTSELLKKQFGKYATWDEVASYAMSEIVVEEVEESSFFAEGTIVDVVRRPTTYWLGEYRIFPDENEVIGERFFV